MTVVNKNKKNYEQYGIEFCLVQVKPFLLMMFPYDCEYIHLKRECAIIRLMSLVMKMLNKRYIAMTVSSFIYCVKIHHHDTIIWLVKILICSVCIV